LRRIAPALLPALAALAGIVGACSSSEPPLPTNVIPLATLASSARAIVETDALDIGEPATRPALWSGWGPDEKNEMMSFVWGAGEASHLRLDVVEPRTRRLLLRGWSYPFGDDPPLEIELRVNGVYAGKRLLEARPGTLQLPVDGDLWRIGENDLELSYSRHLDSPGSPPWAAGWDGLRFDDAPESPPQAPRIGPDGVAVLPARTALEWTVELPPGSFLAWDTVDGVGAARFELSVSDEKGEREPPPGLGARRVRLTEGGGPHRLVRITLRAVGSGGEVRVHSPRLHLPERVAESSASPSAGTSPAAPVDAESRPNIVIYLIDTLRADHLGCYGYPRPTSPEIDRFARTAVLWREGRAQSSWTRPAVATVLTGLEPVTHRTQQSYDRLPQDVEMVSERFQAAGWQTGMLTTNGNVSARLGFNQGWDEFVYLRERRESRAHHVQSPELNREVFRWLDRRDRSKPFFLFVHSSDPHDPYTPLERYRRKLAPDVTDPDAGSRRRIGGLYDLPPDQAEAARVELEQLYDAEIAGNDASFGRLVERLDRVDPRRGTAILLIADHGEEFYEHGGFTHGRTLYEEQLRIPFILRLPHRRAAGTTLAGPAEQIDVVPTLMRVAGIAPDPALPGRDLLDELDGHGPREGEVQSLAWLARNSLSISSIVRSQWKLIRNDRTGGDWDKLPFELYGLGSDAEEQHDLAPSLPLRRSWLEGLLRSGWQRFASGLPGETTELDSELEANLRALGYL